MTGSWLQFNKDFLLFQIDWFFFWDEENGIELMSYLLKFQLYPISSIYLVTLFEETPFKIEVPTSWQAVNAEDAEWVSQVPWQTFITCSHSHKPTWTSSPQKKFAFKIKAKKFTKKLDWVAEPWKNTVSQDRQPDPAPVPGEDAKARLGQERLPDMALPPSHVSAP